MQNTFISKVCEQKPWGIALPVSPVNLPSGCFPKFSGSVSCKMDLPGIQ